MGRFSLYLLQENEEYLTDFACFLFTDKETKGVRGRLKFCSHSLFFDPSDIDKAILRIPFSAVEAVDLKRAIHIANGSPITDALSIKADKHMLMLKDGKWEPYEMVEVKTEFFLQLQYHSEPLGEILSDFNSFVQVHRILGYNQREGKLKHLKEKWLRPIPFDLSWLEIKETILTDVPVKLVVPLLSFNGRVVLTKQRLLFQQQFTLSGNPVERYQLSSITRVLLRRYSLRPLGLEVYYNDKSLFFAFQTSEDRTRFYNLLVQNLPTHVTQASKQLSDITQQWLRREISNYEYLMHVNSFADRTKNDLSQYPVFPWVVADYSSRTLDLERPSTFRDLSLPIGALNNDRLKMVIERYREMPEPKFMYGTHYSTPAYVLYYLIRVHPEYMLTLQNGKFDTPDRLFFSVEHTWKGVTGNLADVKELIPEFYEVPETETDDFLLNSKVLNLGTRQNGLRVTDVELPPWAFDAHDFHDKMREALESEYVSVNLNHWIDLVFGYKQRGEEAEKAFNVFHPMTMHGGDINVDQLEPMERASLEVQIREFGQTPKQLWNTPHPRRIPIQGTRRNSLSLASLSLREDTQLPLTKEEFENKTSSVAIKSLTLEQLFAHSLHRSAVTGIGIMPDNAPSATSNDYLIFTCSKDGLLKLFSMRLDCALRSYNICNLAISDLVLLPKNDFVDVLLSSWDNNVYRFCQVSGKSESALLFDDAASCLCRARQLVAAGSWDGSIQFMKIQADLSTSTLPLRIECDEGILALDLRVDFDNQPVDNESLLPIDGFTGYVTCVSNDGTVHLFSGTGYKLWEVEYSSPQDHINSVKFMSDSRTICLGFGSETEKASKGSLRVIRMEDGTETANIKTSCGIKTIVTYEDGFVFTGDEDGCIRVWNTKSRLQYGCYQAHECCVTSLELNKDVLVSGAADGSIRVWKLRVEEQ